MSTVTAARDWNNDAQYLSEKEIVAKTLEIMSPLTPNLFLSLSEKWSSRLLLIYPHSNDTGHLVCVVPAVMLITAGDNILSELTSIPRKRTMYTM